MRYLSNQKPWKVIYIHGQGQIKFCSSHCQSAKGWIVEELSSVNHIISENIEVKYHRSCCKSYTSKQNFTRYSHKTVSKRENTDIACMNSPVASSVITTRSDWQSCIFCMNKTYKKDGKLHKVEYCVKISRHGRSRAFDTLFSTNDKHVWGMVPNRNGHQH